MSNYTGSRLERTAQRVAKRMGIPVTLGEQDASSHSMELGVLWTQPRRRTYSYLPPVMPQPYSEEDEDHDIDPMDLGDAIFDRVAYVDVILRAPGGEQALFELNMRFLTALDFVRGAADPRRGRWFIAESSDGIGDDPIEGAFEERLRIGLRYPVIRDTFIFHEPPLGLERGIFVNGPTDQEPEEQVLP